MGSLADDTKLPDTIEDSIDATSNTKKRKVENKKAKASKAKNHDIRQMLLAATRQEKHQEIHLD